MLLILVECLMQIQDALISVTSLIHSCIHAGLLLDQDVAQYSSLTEPFLQEILNLNASRVKQDHTTRDCDSNHVEEDNIHPYLFNWLIYPCWAGADNIPHALAFISAWLLQPRPSRAPEKTKRASKWIVYLRYPPSNFTLYDWGFLGASFREPFPPSLLCTYTII